MFDLSSLSSISTWQGYLKKLTWFDWLQVGSLGLGLSLAMIGVVLLLQVAQTSSVVAISPPSEPDLPAQIHVYISGAVARPGVYELNPNDRTSDALELAGGLLPVADSLFVNQKLNLAERLKDEQLLYIPFADEAKSSTSEAPDEVVAGTNGKTAINTASQAELEDLPGVGEKKALLIIQNRPFTSLDDLVVKKVLSQSLLDELRDALVL